jgi:hypothetical protein
MARTFNPQFAEILSEAFSRIEIRPLQVTQEHIDEALRSANFLLTEMTNRGVTQFQLIEQEITLVAGTATYDLMEGALDVWHAVYTRDGSDTPIWPFSRSDYHSIPDKTAAGRSNQYFTDRGKTGNTRRTITLWPVPDRADTLNLWVWARADTQTNDISLTAPIAAEFVDAYADGLGKRLAKKFNRLKVSELSKDFEESFGLAFTTARERTPLRIRMRGYTKGRRFS